MEIRWLGKVEITFKSLFLPFPSVYPWWREDSHHVRWLGGAHRRSHNYSQYLEATNWPPLCMVDRTIIRGIWKLRMGLCSMSTLPIRGEKTPTMSGGSVMCIVGRTIIRSIWKLRTCLCSITNVGLVHRRSHNYSQYLEATNWPL